MAVLDKSAPALLGIVLTWLGLITMASGCADETPPGEAVPVLAAQLQSVDAAVQDRDYAATRAAVEALVAETAKANVAGKITDDQADRILEAAKRLLAELPDADGDGESGLEVPDESQPATDETPSDEEDRETKEGKDKEKDEEKDD